MEGLKTVVFATGLCNQRCYYCPISLERKGRDVMYANEEPIDSLAEIIEEVLRNNSLGASITGGEPLLVLDRVVRTISSLKKFYGDNFHVHLYTNGALASLDALKRLEKAGLDEIRFHPRTKEAFDNLRAACRELAIDVGVEVPAIPGEENWLMKVIDEAADAGVSFININELEVSEANIDALTLRGLELEGAVVKQSLELALSLARYAEERGVPVHVCTAKAKDFIQMRLRLRRKAKNIALPYEEVSVDGTLLFVELRGCKGYQEKLRCKPSEAEKYKGLCREAWLVELLPAVKRIIVLNEERLW